RHSHVTIRLEKASPSSTLIDEGDAVSNPHSAIRNPQSAIASAILAALRARAFAGFARARVAGVGGRVGRGRASVQAFRRLPVLSAVLLALRVGRDVRGCFVFLVCAHPYPPD